LSYTRRFHKRRLALREFNSALGCSTCGHVNDFHRLQKWFREKAAL